MKQSKWMDFLWLPAVLLGLGGLACRSFLLADGMDAEGLLDTGHPMRILFWSLAGLLFLWAVFCAFRKSGELGAAPTGPVPGAAQIVSGLSVCWAAWSWEAPGILRILGGIAGILSLAEGIARVQGKKVTVLGHGLPCGWMCAYMILRYSRWRGDPQVELFLAPVLGLFLYLMLSYELAAWDLHKASRRWLTVLSVLGVFFCLSAFGGPEWSPLHVGGLILSLMTLCSLGSSHA